MLLINLLFTVTCQIVVMITVMVVAQRIQNEDRMLRVILARIYNNFSIYPNRPERKKIRNFYRMALKNPVEINSVVELGVGMALLPTCVSVAVSYVIIMLQFNHTV
ncbi:uncharacterized protein LOC115443116 [Manduca sexta]|uniref:uncharacterized protein LOC115443116 n=1 Tax=Manduca sexta TaxID=7130 RepID=UPI00188E6106|nr:uncharacterized protein LOC115443116 [Manduca sexta]